MCPECAGEFRPDVERCSDCGVPLVFPEEIAARDARELRPSPCLIMLRTAPIAWVRNLAADLEKQGIPYRIDRRRAREDGLLTLSVRSQDRQKAKAVDEARERIEDPDGLAAVDQEQEDDAEPSREAATYKVCPRCGGEYRLEAESCADCGCALVFADEELAADEEAEDETAGSDGREETWHEVDPDFVENLPYSGVVYELPPSDDLVCICCRSASRVQRVSQALDQAQISHRLDPAPYGSRGVNCLYVLPTDGDRAASIDDALWSAPLDGSAVEELSSCPACGKPHPPGARECSGCGLILGAGPGIDTSCTRCGAVIGVDVLHCPNCAAEMPRI